MKLRDEELKKEREKQRLRELEEEEAEAEEAEAVNVSDMNDEERRQHEVDKLIHNKIAKEFQMKARMKAKMRKAEQREKLLKEAQAAAAGLQVPDEPQQGPMSELLARKLSQMNGTNQEAAAFSSLHRSSSMNAMGFGASRNKFSSMPGVSRASSMKSSSGGSSGRIGMTINTTFDTNSNGPPSLNRQNSLSSTGSGALSSRSGSSDENVLVTVDDSAFVELNKNLSMMNGDASNSGFPVPFPMKRSSSYSENNHQSYGSAATSGTSQSNNQYKSSMYRGTLNQDELDGGYGLGMALTKKRKEELEMNREHASLFSAVTSNGVKISAPLSRTASTSVAAGKSGKTLKRIRPSSSSVSTVYNKSYVFGTDNSRTGFGGGGSMSGFGGGEDSYIGSNMGISRTTSASAASGPSLFSKIADAASKKDHLLKKSSSLVGMRNF